MKAAYLGGLRGHQMAVYRPGTGWSGNNQGRRFGRQPQAFKNDGRLHVCPLTTTHRRRPGLRTKTLIVSTVLMVATLLAMVLSGGVQL
jgi:hypothetical protein